MSKFPHLDPDDDILKIVAWIESLEGTIENFSRDSKTWTSAILEMAKLSSQQNNLIVSQNSEMMKIAESNNKLSNSLSQSATETKELKTELSELKNSMKLLSSNSETWSKAIQSKVERLEKSETHLPSAAKAKSNSDSLVWGCLILLAVGVGWAANNQIFEAQPATKFGRALFFKNADQILKCKKQKRQNCPMFLPQQ